GPWGGGGARSSHTGGRPPPTPPPAPRAAPTGGGAGGPRAPNAPPAATGSSISWGYRGRFCARSRSPPSAASGCSRATIGSMAGGRPEAKIASSMPLFATTIAGSLPKPAWLAEPNRLWAPWRAAGAALADAKRDAAVLALKLQEDCGIDVVTDG